MPRPLRVAAAVIAIAAITLAVAPPLSSSTSDVGVGRVELGFRPATSGATLVDLPPLGSVGAPTHPGPVQVRLELKSLDVNRLVDDTGRTDLGKVADDIRADLPAAVRVAVLRLAVVATAVGAVAGAAVWSRRWRPVLAGAGIGLVTALALMASALPGFDAKGFDDVAVKGSLSSGSQLLASITSNPSSGVGRRIDSLAERVAGLYSATLSDDVDATAGTTVILHISDVHLNPVGIQLARRLAEAFDVDAVLDTGDTTSFGTPFEGSFADLVADFPVPYLFVGGNHDSIPNRAAITAAPGVESIHGRIRTIRGVRILGFDDPVVTTTRHVPRDEQRRIELAASSQLAALTSQLEPDLVAVHNPLILREVVGRVPVAVAGHTHRFEMGASDGTLVAVVGSTGATGLGSLLTEDDLPYAAQLLRFDRGRLVAVDRIEVVGTGGDLEVRRRAIRDADFDGETAGFIGRQVVEADAPASTDAPTTTLDVLTPVEESATTTMPVPTTG